MDKRSQAGEHGVAPYPVTDKKGGHGPTKPQNTHEPETSCNDVKGKIGGLGQRPPGVPRHHARSGPLSDGASASPLSPDESS